MASRKAVTKLAEQLLTQANIPVLEKFVDTLLAEAMGKGDKEATRRYTSLLDTIDAVKIEETKPASEPAKEQPIPQQPITRQGGGAAATATKIR